MLTCTINGEARTLPEPLTVAQLLDRLGYDRRRVAVEINGDVVPAARHGEQSLTSADRVEIVTLVGGGSGENEEWGVRSEEKKAIS
ncbi:MAG TPA: sulfur carrier protein ThiS, partial [Gemmataceae bacterium]|nr:sulfur carrier protein ThiS [Gemmataceae bacterium]